MKKIKECYISAFCWLQATVCFAMDKFEVLPDLPEPVSCALQPAEASTVSVKSSSEPLLQSQVVGHEPSLISVVLSLIFVILLIYLTRILYTKMSSSGFNSLQKQKSDFEKSQARVISTTSLGGSKTLHVVELDGKRMLIGASAGTIQLIKDLGVVSDEVSDNETAHIEIPNIKIPKIEIPKIEIPTINFSKLVTKIHNDYQKNDDLKEFTNDTEEDVQTNESAVNEKEPEEIIDTLFTEGDAVQNTNNKVITEHQVDPDEYALYKKYLG